jgi:molybdopterin-containing oxidoreductase family iron-sulfur binding subunit
MGEDDRVEQSVKTLCDSGSASGSSATSSNDSSATPKPTYWRSLSELDGDPEFQEFVSREFATPLEDKPLSSPGRRRFMQLMGASFALAGCRWKEDKLLPATRRPEGMIPGEPVYYATVMEIAGVATGLFAKSFDGRPIKIEGNPQDPTSLGGTNSYHQASVLGLYDPDRGEHVARMAGSRTVSSWDEFGKASAELMSAAAKNGGAGFVVLSESSASPSLIALKGRLLKKLPQAQWVAYEPTYAAGVAQGAELAFGSRVRTVLAPEKADVIVSLDGDFVGPADHAGLANARAVANRRDPDAGEMSRIYTIESSYSELAAIADHRLMLRSSQIAAVAAYLDSQIAPKAPPPAPASDKAATPAPDFGPAQAEPKAKFIEGEAKKFLDVVVKDLLAHAGKSLIVAGSKQPAEVHALVHRLNALLGNVGQTVTYLVEPEGVSGGAAELAALVADMQGGKVETLLILGGNPAYNAPADVDFAAALGKVKNTIRLGLYEDETSKLAQWYLPQAHYLETWGDARAFDGSVRLAQPLIAPLRGGKSSVEVLAGLLGEAKTDGRDIVQATHGLKDKEWRKAVHDGRFGEPSKAAEVKLRPLAEVKLSPSALAGSDAENGALEVVFEASPSVFDGRYGNNGWLQELPHPLSKLAWGNAALVAPETADALGLKDGHLVKVTLDGRSIELPLMHTPGQAPGTVGLTLGYGREVAGKVGGLRIDPTIEVVGSNTYELYSAKQGAIAVGGSLAAAGPRQELAITQDLYAIDAVGKAGIAKREDELIREATYEEYKHHPGVIKHKVHHPPLLSLWQPPVSYDGHKWGMTIDLNKCTGCAGCIVACQAENNIPVVGKSEVKRGREMTWLRVERYYKGDRKAASVRQQPVLCQQCENAPCEQVCPVGATMHSHEGLNDMVYNRCIGTRYCSNNCPYKVRRFNYRNYNMDTIGMTPFTGTDDPKAKLKSMVFNPDVTVRSRGVMEKCTFCVQRIQNVKIKAKNAKRPVKDGEIKTACEQACPTGAIVFGDLNDKTSKVAAGQRVPRAYELLQELNNRPRVNYLARISNPHPELSTRDGHSSEH